MLEYLLCHWMVLPFRDNAFQYIDMVNNSCQRGQSMILCIINNGRITRQSTLHLHLDSRDVTDGCHERTFCSLWDYLSISCNKSKLSAGLCDFMYAEPQAATYCLFKHGEGSRQSQTDHQPNSRIVGYHLERNFICRIYRCPWASALLHCRGGQEEQLLPPEIQNFLFLSLKPKFISYFDNNCSPLGKSFS